MNRQQNYGTMTEVPEVQFGGTSANTPFHSLCDNVVTNMYNINSAWKTLTTALKSIGTYKDNKGLRDRM